MMGTRSKFPRIKSVVGGYEGWNRHKDKGRTGVEWRERERLGDPGDWREDGTRVIDVTTKTNVYDEEEGSFVKGVFE